MRTTKLVTISIPPELLKKVEKLARKENRTRSEFFRETVRQYLAREKYKILQKEREEAFSALEKIWGKMKGEKPEVIEKTIGEALRSARNV